MELELQASERRSLLGRLLSGSARCVARVLWTPSSRLVASLGQVICLLASRKLALDRPPRDLNFSPMALRRRGRAPQRARNAIIAA